MNSLFTHIERETLGAVLTASEVMRYWGVSQSKLMNAIMKDRITARSTGDGRVWLCSKVSVLNLWGEPLIPLELEK